MIKSSLILFLLVVGSWAVNGNKGACKTQNYQDVNVDWNRYLGKWYNVRVSDSFLFQSPTDQCTTALYSLNSDGSVKVDNQAIKQDNSISQAIGKATIYAPGHLKVQFYVPVSANYEIVYINDDYTVATVVGCNGVGFLGYSDVWVLARNYNESQVEIQKALDAASNMGFDLSGMITNNTSQCNLL